jgi:hypothetical protein
VIPPGNDKVPSEATTMDNNHEDTDPAKQYKVYVYEGDNLKDDLCCTVENGAETIHYLYTY